MQNLTRLAQVCLLPLPNIAQRSKATCVLAVELIASCCSSRWKSEKGLSVTVLATVNLNCYQHSTKSLNRSCSVCALKLSPPLSHKEEMESISSHAESFCQQKNTFHWCHHYGAFCLGEKTPNHSSKHSCCHTTPCHWLLWLIQNSAKLEVQPSSICAKTSPSFFLGCTELCRVKSKHQSLKCVRMQKSVECWFCFCPSHADRQWGLLIQIVTIFVLHLASRLCQIILTAFWGLKWGTALFHASFSSIKISLLADTSLDGTGDHECNIHRWSEPKRKTKPNIVSF